MGRSTKLSCRSTRVGKATTASAASPPTSATRPAVERIATRRVTRARPAPTASATAREVSMPSGACSPNGPSRLTRSGLSASSVTSALTAPTPTAKPVAGAAEPSASTGPAARRP